MIDKPLSPIFRTLATNSLPPATKSILFPISSKIILLVKLVLVYIAAWISGLLSSLLISNFYYNEPFSFADLFGFATLSFLPALLVCALLYTPGLFYLKHRLKGCKPAILFPVVSTFILNAPVGLMLLWLTGRTMRGSEAVSFVVIFLVMGLLSGIGFVWLCDGSRERQL